MLLGLLIFIKEESYYRLGGGLTVICRCAFGRTMQFLSYCFVIFGLGNGNTTMSICILRGFLFEFEVLFFSKIPEAFRNFARGKSRFEVGYLSGHGSVSRR